MLFVSFEQPARRYIGGDLYQTTEDWGCVWVCYRRGALRNLFVPGGYVWDGVSVPRVGWSLVGLTPSGPGDGPSLAHDALYRAKGGGKPAAWKGCRLVDEDGAGANASRAEADDLFRAMLVKAGTRKAQARIAHAILRAFGRRHWGGPIPALR